MEPQIGVAIGGAIFMLANVLLFWIREWYKHKTWSKNGDDLKVIKEDVKTTNGKIDCIDGKVGDTKIAIAEVKVAVTAQQKQCSKTVSRFDEAISKQYSELIGLAKTQGGKK